ADYFEATVRGHRNPKAASNWIMGELLRLIRERKLDSALVIREWPVPADRLAALIALIGTGEVSGKSAKPGFEGMGRPGKTPAQIVAEQGLTQVSDVPAIQAAVDRVVAAHPDKAAEYRAGKDKLFGFFVGQVMKDTQGKANPQKVNELLKAKLGG